MFSTLHSSKSVVDFTRVAVNVTHTQLFIDFELKAIGDNFTSNIIVRIIRSHSKIHNIVSG